MYPFREASVQITRSIEMGFNPAPSPRDPLRPVPSIPVAVGAVAV